MSEFGIAEQIDALRTLAHEEGVGPTQVALLEQAVRLADTHHEVRLGWETRLRLVEATIFAEQAEKAISPFVWCVAASDRDPERFHESRLLWPFKWVVNNAKTLAKIPMPSLLAMLDDMERRFVRQGASLRAVQNQRWRLSWFRGMPQDAREAFDRWDALPRDEYADCLACEQNDRVGFLAFEGRDEDAVAAARPILSGRMRCVEIPKNTYKYLFLPLMNLGRVSEAMDLHRKGYRQIATHPMYVEDAAHHITFLALTDNLARGLKMFETHLPGSRDAVGADREDRFTFAMASRFLMERAAVKKSSLRMRLPETFSGFTTSGQYDPKTLEALFDEEAKRLATIFDARNGTSEFARRMEENRTLAERVIPFPTSGKSAE